MQISTILIKRIADRSIRTCAESFLSWRSGITTFPKSYCLPNGQQAWIEQEEGLAFLICLDFKLNVLLLQSIVVPRVNHCGANSGRFRMHVHTGEWENGIWKVNNVRVASAATEARMVQSRSALAVVCYCDTFACLRRSRSCATLCTAQIV